MFSWPFRGYSYPCLQAAELLNGIWYFGKTQKMLLYVALVNRCSLMGPSHCTTEQNIFQTRIWVFQEHLVCSSSKADFALGRHLSRCSSPAMSFLEKELEEPRKKCLLGQLRRWGPWEPWAWVHPPSHSKVRGISELRCLWSFPSLWWPTEPRRFAFSKEILWPLQWAGYLAFAELQKNYSSCRLHHDLCAVCTSKIPRKRYFKIQKGLYFSVTWTLTNK